jgi:hypothetical protein
MTTDESTFAFGPRPNRGYLGLSKVQIGSAIFTATCAVVAMYVVGGVLGLPVGLAILALGALVTFTTRAGFPLLAWAPVVARSLLRERVWLHSGPTAQGTALALPKSLGKIDALSVPGSAWLDDAGAVGLIDVTAPTSFGLAGSGSRDTATNGWATTLASLAEPGSLVSAVSWTVKVGPADADALPGWAAANTAADARPELVTSYGELIADAGPVGQHHVHTVAVRLRESRATNRAAKLAGGIGPLVARESGRLASQLGDIGASAFPLSWAGGVRERVVSHLDLLHPAQVAVPVVAMADEWDHVRVDGTYWRVLWVAEWPQVPVQADFLSPLLLHCRSPRVVTLNVSAVSADNASKSAERASSGQESDVRLLAEAGVRVTARRQRAMATTQQREDELTSGHALLRYSALVAVNAADRAALEDCTAEVVAAAASARLRLRVLYGRQAAALTASLPMAKVTR